MTLNTSLIVQAVDSLAHASSFLALLLVAGLATASVGFLISLAARRRSFALRASLLHTCILLLLAISISAADAQCDSSFRTAPNGHRADFRRRKRRQ